MALVQNSMIQIRKQYLMFKNLFLFERTDPTVIQSEIINVKKFKLIPNESN